MSWILTQSPGFVFAQILQNVGQLINFFLLVTVSIPAYPYFWLFHLASFAGCIPYTMFSHSHVFFFFLSWFSCNVCVCLCAQHVFCGSTTYVCWLKRCSTTYLCWWNQPFWMIKYHNFVELDLSMKMSNCNGASTLYIHRTLWWTNMLQWKITIFNGKINELNGHFQ